MDRPQAERPKPSRAHKGIVATETNGSQVSRVPHQGIDLLFSPERCVSVELDQSLRECVQSYLLTQNTPDHAERQLKETQSRLSAASAADGETEDLRELRTLEKQKQELLYINKKWAEQYETMTRFYKEKVKEQRKLMMSHGEERRQEEGEEEGQRQMKTDLAQSKYNPDQQRGNCDVGAELLRAEREAEHLRAQNTTLARRGQQQRGEIRRLNEALTGALQTPALAEVTSETQEELWKHQAQIYKEDFLKERRDREKLKEKHTALEERFRKVYTELNALKSQVTWTPTLPRPAAACVCTHRARSPTQDAGAQACCHTSGNPHLHTQRSHHLQKNKPPS